MTDLEKRFIKARRDAIAVPQITEVKIVNNPRKQIKNFVFSGFQGYFCIPIMTVMLTLPLSLTLRV